MATKTKTDAAVQQVEVMADQATFEVQVAAENVKGQAKKAKPAMQHAEEAVAEVKTETMKMARIRVPKPVRQAYLASLGAVSMAQDESGHLFNKLVEQGAEAEKEGRQWLRRTNKRTRVHTNKATDRVEESVEAASDRVEQTVERVLAKLNVPTKSDIERLSQKITELTHKVDALKVANGHKTEA